MRRFGGAISRLELTRARSRLDRVSHGADLLRRKREALVTRLFEIARPAVDTRRHLRAASQQAADALLFSLATHGSGWLRASGWPEREVDVEVRPVDAWGVRAAEVDVRTVVRRSASARGTTAAMAGPAVTEAADRYEEVVADLLNAASRELLVRRLGDALATTSRQVNTLERRVAPRIEEWITLVTRGLEEREREEQVRLRRLLGRRHSRPTLS